YLRWVDERFLATSQTLLSVINECKRLLDQANQPLRAWAGERGTPPSRQQRDSVATLLQEASEKLRAFPAQVIWPDRPLPRLPQVLVIDDELGRLKAAMQGGVELSPQGRKRLSEFQVAFCQRFHLSPADGSTAIHVDQPIGEVYFCAGQGYDQKNGFMNDLGMVEQAVENGKYALVLVDVVFNTGKPTGDGMGPRNTQFGLEQVLPWLRKGDPTLPVLVLTSDATEELIERIQAQGVDYLHKSSDEVDLMYHIFKGGRAAPEQIRVALGVPDGLVADDPKMLGVLRQAWHVARREKGKPILILGESGAGKEKLARFIHDASRRAGKPFKRINCANLTRDLSTSQLFGYYKGAFTGADRDTPGAFHEVDGGTLQLDEFGDLDEVAQARLLRALQDHWQNDRSLREIEPLGQSRGASSLSTLVDVLVIGSTNRSRDQIRQELVARFGEFITIPPLHERPGDIVPIAKYLLEDRLGHPGLRLNKDAQRFLREMVFPGNVRTLEALLTKAAEGKGRVNLLTEQDIRAARNAGLGGQVARAEPTRPGPAGTAESLVSSPPIVPPSSQSLSLDGAVTALLSGPSLKRWGELTMQHRSNINTALRGHLVEVVTILLEWALSQSEDVPSLAHYLTGQKLQGRYPQDVVKRWLKLDPRIIEHIAGAAESLANGRLKELISEARQELQDRRRKQ
ncbi:MAG: sigma 54-interacting transcriptional regulator, partial [Bryobacteraceae bacterium]